MKQRIQGLIAGILIGAVCTGGAVFAKNASETIEVLYDNIKIFVDGEQIDPKDANGQTVEPFIYNGTTYLPVRAVGNAFGKDVSWDGVEKVVYLGAKPGETENWLTECGPYEYKEGEEYLISDNRFFEMSGNKYTNGFTLCAQGYDPGTSSEAMFNLNGQYNSVSFTVGHVDGTDLSDAIMNIYVDGVIAYTKELKYSDVAQQVTVPLNGALQMRIEILRNGMSTSAWYGFSEGNFE